MRILYGVSGEGFGHSSRTKVIVEHLLKNGHKVLIVTYGQAYPILKKFKPLKVEGVHLYFNKKGLSLNRTFSKNLSRLIKNIKNWGYIKEKIEKFSPELCFSDMEPIVPIFCYWNKVPLISIDNQHRLTHMDLKIPRKYQKDYLLARYAIKRCISKADAYVILSFTKGKVKGKNSFIVNPILRKEILNLKTKKGGYILVYQTKKNRRLIKILKKIPEKFIVYGYNKEKRESNINYKRNNIHFLKYLASSKAIIGTAGFTLISESIYLKKPYFAIPLKGQFEQMLNALFLKRAQLGEFSESPNKEEIMSFIKKLNIYEKNLISQKRYVNEAIQIIDRIIKEKQ